jgi:hypothetical protein
MFFTRKGYIIRATFNYISREQNPQIDYLARQALMIDAIMCFVVGHLTSQYKMPVMLMVSPLRRLS